jgi:CRISPR-associated exonuclease Cas4
MWYVTCTRAEELLIIPEMPRSKYPTWAGIVDLNVGALPSFPVEDLTPVTTESEIEPPNEQTAEIFEAEFAAIAAKSIETKWVQPSAHDDDRAELIEALMIKPQDTQDVIAPIGSGKVRGLTLHKLIEEILTGETREDEEELIERASELLRQLETEAEDGAVAPDPAELAATVLRTLRIPDVARLPGSAETAGRLSPRRGMTPSDNPAEAPRMGLGCGYESGAFQQWNYVQGRARVVVRFPHIRHSSILTRVCTQLGDSR